MSTAAVKQAIHPVAGLEGWICPSCQSPAAVATRSPRFAALQGRTDNKAQGTTAYVKRRLFSSSIFLRASQKRKSLLPERPVRTRFAPSPTGFLHIGGLRTALFSYLLAKRTCGQFLLRVEDTDQKRLVPGAEDRLLEDLYWAGVQWDEGPGAGGPHGPYRQSERTKIYQQHAETLLDGNNAYRCFCTTQTPAQSSLAYVTSGCYQNCAALSEHEARSRAHSGGEPFTIRLRRTRDQRAHIYSDLVYGKITPLKRSAPAVASSDEESTFDAADTILIKSDGTPTYHFANVVDDHLMKITHVVRGTEWIASTPLHYDLYHAFGWDPPEYAHVGLLVDEKKAKLSKRNADLALDVKSMRDGQGVLPETLCNFLALLGWSNPGDNDVYTMDDLISNFDLKFTKGNTMVRMEKLWFLQKHHVARRCNEARASGSIEPIQVLLRQISEEAMRRFPALEQRFGTHDSLAEYCTDILLADDKSYQNARQYVDRNQYFFGFDQSLVPPLRSFYDQRGQVSTSEARGLVEIIMQSNFKQALPGDGSTTASTADCDISRSQSRLRESSARIHATMDSVIASTAGDDNSLTPMRRTALNTAVMRYLRDRLSYGFPGPSVGMVMAILGYLECCTRLSITADEGRGW